MPRYLHISHTADTARTMILSGRNCLKGLKKILGTNAISVAGSDGDRHATPATMYSVDAPVYNTMGQQVDKSHKGLVIYKGKKYLQQ